MRKLRMRTHRFKCGFKCGDRRALRGVSVFSRLAVGGLAAGMLAAGGAMTTYGADAGLAASYSFSGNAIDGSGHGNDGSVVGAALTVDRFGKAGRAYTFGPLAGGIQVPDSSANLDLTGDFTLAFWIRPTGTTGGWVLNKHQGDVNEDGSWWLALFSDGRLHFQATPHFDDSAPISSAITVGRWTFVALTYERATGAWRFYIDGQPDTAGAVALAIADNAQPLVIGDRQDSSPFPFPGAIDDIAIYKRALSAGEVRALGQAPSVLTVLAHGWCGSPDTTFGQLPTLLRERGAVEPFDYSGDDSPIDAFTRSDLVRTAGKLGRFVLEKMETHGVSQVDAVVHSAGGLVLSAWMAGLADVPYNGEVRRLVFAGTPHFGVDPPFKHFRVPICEENDRSVTAAQLAQMSYGSYFIQSLREAWEEAVATGTVVPSDILTVVGCGAPGSTSDRCVSDIVVLPASATLPTHAPADYARSYVPRVHTSLPGFGRGLMDVSGPEDPVYVLIKSFLDPLPAQPLPVAEAPPRTPALVVLRLTDERGRPFGETGLRRVQAATHNHRDVVFDPEPPSAEPTGWWTMINVPPECCPGPWTIDLQDPRSYRAHEPGFDVMLTPGRPVLPAPFVVGPARPLPDLAVSDVNVAVSATSSHRIIVSATIKNTGTTRSNRGDVSYLLASSPEALDHSVSLGQGRDVPQLAPGEQVRVSARLEVPLGTTPGLYAVVVCADPSPGHVDEVADANNCAAAGGRLPVQ